MNENLDLKFPTLWQQLFGGRGVNLTHRCVQLTPNVQKNKNKQKSLLAIDDGCWGIQLDKVNYT
jgi:hypothetical protein